MIHQFYMPSRILFGTGSLKKLHEQRLPGIKALIVISNGKTMQEQVQKQILLLLLQKKIRKKK